MSDEPEESPDRVLRSSEPTEASTPTEVPATEMVDVAAEAVPAEVAEKRAEPWSSAGTQHEELWFDLEAATANSERSETETAVGGTRLVGRSAAGLAGLLSAARQNREELTVPRVPFLVGAGGAALAIVVLFALWQRAGDPSPVPTVSADRETLGLPADDAAVAADPEPTSPIGVVDARIVGLETTIDENETTIAALQAELAAAAPPALRGDEMRRIVVAADASFVSVGSASVAVIGPFGGYAAIDPATNAVTIAGQVASGATRVLRTNAAVWITNYADNEIVRIDRTTGTAVIKLDFPGPDGLAKLGDTLVVASFDDGFVAQVDPAEEVISRQVEVGGAPTDVFVTADERSIWVALSDTGEIVRIDAASFEVRSRVTVGSGPIGLDAAGGVLWIVNHAEGTVVGVDLASEKVVANYPVGPGPTAATVFNGSLWVTVTDAGELLELDPATGETITRTPLGTSNRGGPTGLAVGDGSLWVAMQGERSVVRITLASS